MPTTANKLQKGVDATHCTDSRITDDGTDVNVDAGGGSVILGDATFGNGSNFIQVNDSIGEITLYANESGASPSHNANIVLSGAVGNILFNTNTNAGAGHVPLKLGLGSSTRAYAKIGDNGGGNGTSVVVDDDTTLITHSAPLGIRIITSGSKPAAASGVRGTVFVTQGGEGVADAVEICVKLANDTYAWVSLI